LKILFLDVDGVLNSHDFSHEAKSGIIHPDKMALLNKVLTITDAKVVVSSSWRYLLHRGEVTLEGLDWMLRTHGMMHSRLVGVTRRDTMEVRMQPWVGKSESWPVENERGLEIADWVREHPVNQYAVVDDLDLGIKAAGHPFVQTDGKVGLTATNAFDLVGLLS